LIAEWRGQYRQAPKKTFYTLKHGAGLQKALQPQNSNHWLYAGYSAADWLAPWVRQNVLFVVADMIGLEELTEKLQLEESKKGFNVVVSLDPDGNLLHDRFEVSDGVWTTSPLETYLNLYQSHDRGREAAELIAKKYFGSKP
jgi:hypothetical protein